MRIASYHLTNLFFLVYDTVKYYVRKGEHRDDEVLILFLKADGLKDFFGREGVCFFVLPSMCLLRIGLASPIFIKSESGGMDLLSDNGLCTRAFFMPPILKKMGGFFRLPKT